jgi:hypothetical protein
VKGKGRPQVDAMPNNRGERDMMLSPLFVMAVSALFGLTLMTRAEGHPASRETHMSIDYLVQEIEILKQQMVRRDKPAWSRG